MRIDSFAYTHTIIHGDKRYTPEEFTKYVEELEAEIEQLKRKNVELKEQFRNHHTHGWCENEVKAPLLKEIEQLKKDNADLKRSVEFNRNETSRHVNLCILNHAHSASVDEIKQLQAIISMRNGELEELKRKAKEHEEMYQEQAEEIYRLEAKLTLCREGLKREVAANISNDKLSFMYQQLNEIREMLAKR